MRIAEYGKEFEYGDQKFIVGEVIIATEGSIYEGLPGILMEVRDGEDKETDNVFPDLYCAFFEPVLPENKEKISKKASVLQRDYETIDKPRASWVILSPQMVTSYDDLKRYREKRTIYLLTTDWAYNGKSGASSELYTDIDDVRKAFEMSVCGEQEYDGISYFGADPNFVMEVTENSIKAFVEGSYMESHYELKIEEKELYMSKDFVSEIGKLDVDRNLYEEFKLHFTDFDGLTNEEFSRIIEKPIDSLTIKTETEQDTTLLKTYRETVFAISRDALNEALKKKREENK